MKRNLIILFLTFVLIFYIFPSTSLAADPKLISKLDSAFSKIEDWLIKLATPAAAVAVGTGVFMKKFSFGDDERMRVGKKLIRTALISYALILVLDLLLSTIQNLLTSA